jgi:hypothetical protein
MGTATFEKIKSGTAREAAGHVRMISYLCMFIAGILELDGFENWLLFFMAGFFLWDGR